VKPVTIAARCGIRISIDDRFPVNTFCVPIVRVAVCALLDHPDFISFPRSHFMDIFMAIFALDVIDEMSTCIMFSPFFLMASMTGDRLGMNLPSLGFPMGFDVRNIPVAAVAGVGTVNGLGEFLLVDLSMAAQTFGVVDTFTAIFPAFDDEFISLLSRFRWLGHLCRLRTLFGRLCRSPR